MIPSPTPPRSRRPLAALALAAALAPAACSTPSATNPTDATPTAHAPEASRSAEPPAPAAAPAGSIAAAPSPTPAGSASAAAPPAPAGSASAAPAEAAPLPAVQVKNIGMHIGGGPNDAETKAPIKLSVEPHFDDLRRCFALVEDRSKAGDFGVDLRIEKDGGKAKVTKPRTALKGEGFAPCMVAAFERIDFRKPKGGATVVSYSVRFTPDPTLDRH